MIKFDWKKLIIELLRVAIAALSGFGAASIS